MQSSPDPCPADCWLAPTELYIVMAITVATFSLLLAPRRAGDPPLSGWIAWPSLAFLLWQVIQVAAYRDIEGWWPSLPVIMHQSTLLVYGIGLCVLLWGGWLNALPADPDLPENDDEPDVPTTTEPTDPPEDSRREEPDVPTTTEPTDPPEDSGRRDPDVPTTTD